MNDPLFCATVQEMQHLSKCIADLSSPPVIIFLSGDLGTGKTTFARAFIQALGYRGKVKSPTYTLVEEYSVKGFEVFHFDFYRVTDIMEFEFIGGRDYFHENSICLIEWPERVKKTLPESDVSLHFSYAGDGRNVHIQINNDIYAQLPEQLNI